MKTSIFKDKVTVITGGHSGIGAAISDAFAAKGCTVIIVGRNEETGRAAAKELSLKYECKASFCTCDITQSDQAQAAIQSIVQDYGQIDFLINNAGIYPAVGLLDMTEATFEAVFRLNVQGVFNITREAALQSMCSRKYGRIISISSVDSWLPTRGITAYAASKAALNSLVKSFAIELSEYGITSNGVAPGWVGTEPVLRAGRYKSQLDQILNKRMAEPSEIADFVTFLCEDKASYMNGEILNVSGGLLLNS
ncbi:MAG: SDR family NAD(P)-dependent oxidoreductase [Lachnospiraceae bacterium]